MSLAQHAGATKLGASMSVAAHVATSPSVADANARISRNDAMNDQTARQSSVRAEFGSPWRSYSSSTRISQPCRRPPEAWSAASLRR